MPALLRRPFRLLVVAALAGVDIFGQLPPSGASQNPVPETGPSCSNVVLRFRCLRQPPIYHSGETIQATLSLSKNGQLGLTAFPDTRRYSFHEIMVWEPKKDAIDPSTLDDRIRVGSTLGSGWSEDRNREVDVNEWVQFQRPGRYVLHVILKHIIPVKITKENRKPWLNCELQSNAESVEILPPDAQWEAAELGRIGKLLESETTRFRGASALRYLSTREAAVALARWYVRMPAEPVKSELATGILESRHADIVQSELEKALRSDTTVSADLVGILVNLEASRWFANRPPPSDPKAQEAWSRDYHEALDSAKRKYSAIAAAAGHPVR